MNKYLQGLVITLFVALLASVSAAAPLTDQQVKNFILSLEALDEIDEEGEELDDWLSTDDQLNDETLQFSMVEMLKHSKDHAFNRKVEKVVQQHGFKNLHQWAEVGDRINAAFMHHAMGDMAELEQQLAEMERELANMPAMTAEQKEAMLGMAAGGMQMISAMSENATPEDVATVGRHLEELQRVYDGD